MRSCKNCQHFTPGVTNEERRRLDPGHTNWGRYANGICHLDFPRGYLDRKAPHLAHSTGSCFQFEERAGDQMTMEVEA